MSRTKILFITHVFETKYSISLRPPPQSVPGSPSKASELNCMMSNNLKHLEWFWRGTWCPITHAQTDHYRYARQVLWWLLRYLPYESQYTKVAAFGRHHKRGRAAFGRATSFVVSFVLAFNRVNVVEVTKILVLHVGAIGYHVPCH